MQETDRKFSFNNTRLKALPYPASRPVWYLDDKTEGLALTVSRTGVKSFIYKRWIGSGKVEKRLGSFDPGARQSESFTTSPLQVLGNNPGLTTEHARILTRAINGSFASGVNPFTRAAEAKTARDGELTIAELFDIYLERHYDGKRKRPKEMRKDFERDCGELASRPLSSITSEDAHRFHARLTRRSSYVANRRVQLMRSLYNKARLWKLYSGDNPFVGITFNKEKARTFTLSPEEAGRLWEAFESDHNEMIRDWGRLAMLTGARKDEINRMRWQDIRWQERYWVVPDTKNDQPRLVALGEKAIEILEERKRRVRGEWVFPAKGVEGPMRDPKKAFERIRARVKLDGVMEDGSINRDRRCTMHDIRRSYGTEMARQGIDRTRIKDALGHKDEKTTAKHYIIAGVDWQREARDKVVEVWVKPSGSRELVKVE